MVPRNGISLLFESSAFESASSFNCAAKVGLVLERLMMSVAVKAWHMCQKACRARHNVRCRGCTAECSRLIPTTLSHYINPVVLQLFIQNAPIFRDRVIVFWSQSRRVKATLLSGKG